MEVVIGVQFSSRELRLELADEPEKVTELVEQAFSEGHKLLWVTDKGGRRVAVPTDKIAYVEVDAGKADKQVGFSVRVES